MGIPPVADVGSHSAVRRGLRLNKRLSSIWPADHLLLPSPIALAASEAALLVDLLNFRQ